MSILPSTRGALPESSATGRGSRDVALLFAMRLATLGFATAMQAVLARTLLPADRGIYALTSSVALFLSMVFTGSVHHGAQYEVLSRRTTPSQGFSSAVAVAAVGSVAAGLLAIPVALLGFGPSGSASERSLLLALAVMPAYAFMMTAHSMLLAFARFGSGGLAELAMILCQLVGTILLAGWLAWGVDGAIVAFTAGLVLFGVVSTGILRRKCGVILEVPRRAGLLAVLRYGRKIHVANICELMETRIAILALWPLASNAEVGLFAASSVLIVGAYALPVAFSAALLPRITGFDQSRSALVAFSLRVVSWVTMLGVLALVALREPVVRVVLGEEFLPATSLVPILGLAMALGAPSMVAVTYLKAEGRPELPSYAALVQVASVVILTFLLYPWMGLVGAAWALAIALAIRFVLLTAFFCRLTGEGWTSAWMLRRADLAMLAQGARAMLSWRTRR